MQTESTAAAVKSPAVSSDGILFLYSPNLGVRVRYGSLVIDLGRGRGLTVDRASEPRLRRLIMAGRGWWSFEVPKFCVDIGASWLHLDLTGRILGSGPGEISPDLPALRRQQALAAGADAGLAIGRELLTRKIASQAAALGHGPEVEQTQTMMREHIDLLETCPDAAALRTAEARAAMIFWQALADLPVRFTAADEPKVPAAWLSVDRRSSAVTGSPRGASTPAHAVWNFAYSCAAGEVGIALRSVGLDPGISPTGLHADTPRRDSASYDVLESVRGDVDRLVLAMISGRRFRRRDFVQQPDGRVRLTAPLARELAEAVLPLSREAVAPIAEGLARMLADSAGGPKTHIPRLPTPLTGDARSRGRDGIRGGARKRPDTSRRVARALLRPACRRCGIVMDDRGRQLCDACLEEWRSEATSRFSARGRETLVRMKVEGRDPARTPQAIGKMRQSKERTLAADQKWNAIYRERPDRDAFLRDVLPLILDVPVSALSAATGLSKSHCAKIRCGQKVPHPRHWQVIADLAAQRR